MTVIGYGSKKGLLSPFLEEFNSFFEAEFPDMTIVNNNGLEWKNHTHNIVKAMECYLIPFDDKSLESIIEALFDYNEKIQAKKIKKIYFINICGTKSSRMVEKLEQYSIKHSEIFNFNPFSAKLEKEAKFRLITKSIANETNILTDSIKANYIKNIMKQS